MKYEEIPNGARLMLTPKDAAQLSEFRMRVRDFAERMKKGDTMMMHRMMRMMEKSEPIS